MKLQELLDIIQRHVDHGKGDSPVFICVPGEEEVPEWNPIEDVFHIEHNEGSYILFVSE